MDEGEGKGAKNGAGFGNSDDGISALDVAVRLMRLGLLTLCVLRNTHCGHYHLQLLYISICGIRLLSILHVARLAASYIAMADWYKYRSKLKTRDMLIEFIASRTPDVLRAERSTPVTMPWIKSN